MSSLKHDNEIRDNNNVTLPPIASFDRFKFNEYQPVQGILKIANPND